MTLIIRNTATGGTEGDILDPRHPPIPLRPLQPCVACGEPSRARWCSDACMRAIERRGMLAPAFVVRGWTASSTTTRLRKTNERPRLLRSDPKALGIEARYEVTER